MQSLPLFHISGKPERPPLVGIARLASQGESIREGHNVEYFTLPAKSLLNRCVSARQMPFTWTINPYRGCEFGCRYCYARYTHEFMEMHDGMDFEQKIYVKQHAADLLRQELRRLSQMRPSLWVLQPTPTSRRSADTKSHVGFWKSLPVIKDSNWASSRNQISFCAILICWGKWLGRIVYQSTLRSRL